MQLRIPNHMLGTADSQPTNPPDPAPSNAPPQTPKPGMLATCTSSIKNACSVQ